MSKPREINLSTTPSGDDIAKLQLGDIVYLSGLMYTAREGVYMRALEDKANIPMELPSQSAANFHCSPPPELMLMAALTWGLSQQRPLSVLPNGFPNGWLKQALS